MKDTSLTKFLACICIKHTKEMISDIFEIEARNPYEICDSLEILTGIKLDGETNYVDFIHLDDERRKLWDRGYIC